MSKSKAAGKTPTDIWENAQAVSDPLEGLAFFDRIAAFQSVSGAARYLDIPRATLSRRLSELEASLGVQLFHRTTRRLTLTAAGTELFSRTRRLLTEAEAARDAVRRLDGVPRGTVRISIPGSTLAFEPAIHKFLQMYPETKLEVTITPRFVDLRAEGFDIALRAGKVDDPGLIVHSLGETAVFPVASPAYLEKHGAPQSPADLKEHECLLSLDLHNRPRAHWLSANGEEVPVTGRLISNHINLLYTAAIHGQGIALLPALLTAEALSAGQLVPVLGEVMVSSSPISFVHPYTELIEPRIRAFIDVVTPMMSDALERERNLFHSACAKRKR